MSATNRGAQRHPYDLYSTPAWCTGAIARQIVWPSNALFLEPCKGSGVILDIVRPYVLYADWCEIQEGRDFLTWDGKHVYGRAPSNKQYDVILTNPPFSLAQEFIEKSLILANCVVMLLRLNFLASKSRKEFWEKHPPTAIHVLTKRPSFTGGGTDATDYAWFVWDSTGRQKRGIFWL